MLLRKSTESNVDKATEQAILWVQMTNIRLAFVLNSLPQCYSTCCSPPLLPNYTRVDLTATFKERSWETKTFLERLNVIGRCVVLKTDYFKVRPLTFEPARALYRPGHAHKLIAVSSPDSPLGKGQSYAQPPTPRPSEGVDGWARV